MNILDMDLQMRALEEGLFTMRALKSFYFFMHIFDMTYQSTFVTTLVNAVGAIE